MKLITSIFRNKKRIFSLFLFIISLQSVHSQELLLSILDSLQVDFIAVNTHINNDSCSYFDNMTNKRNFKFRDKDVQYIIATKILIYT